MLMDEQNHFTSDKNSLQIPDSQKVVNNDSLSWSAPEFIDRFKGISWYIFFIFSILVVSGLVYLFSRSIYSAIAIAILGISLSYMATRKPKEINCTINGRGIEINNVLHPFSDYKSYTMSSDAGIDRIDLISVKRFTPNKVIYFLPEDRSKINTVLGEFLAFENISSDRIENFMKKIGL